MSSLEGDFSLCEGDFAWIMKLTEEDDNIVVPAKKLSDSTASTSSSPERRTSSSGYNSSSQGSDQDLLVSTSSNHGSSSSPPPAAAGSLPKMTFNPWVTPFNPYNNCWEPIPEVMPTPKPSQTVNQSQELVPLWSQAIKTEEGRVGGGSSIRQMISQKPISHCPPHPLEVHNGAVPRNYSMECRNPLPPYSIALEPNGEKYWGITVHKFTDRLYVADRGNNDVLVIDPSVGKPILRFGQDPVLCYSSNQLYRPTGLAVDETHKRLLICDKDNHRICIFTVDGHYISSFGKKGHGAGEFNYPWDVDVSPNGGMIVVSDSKNHRIQIFDRFGNYLKKFTVFESDPFEYKKYFDYPRGISFDNEGQTIYCTDFNTNNVISLVVESLEYKMLIPYGKLNRPQGITVDEAGNLLVCDSRKNCIRAVTPQGDLLTSLNRVGRTQIHVPVDATMLRGGQVATLGINGRIYFF